MPATPARIAFVREEWRRATSESPEVRARHGSMARESDDPIETFFDDVADAQVMADERQALLSPERRRFGITVAGLEEALALDYESGTIPTADFTDPRFQVERKVLMAEIGFDFAKQDAPFMVWG